MKTAALLLILMAAVFAASTVTEQNLRDAQADPATWLTYGKNYLGWRSSDLTEINTETVSRLAPRWIYQTGASGTARDHAAGIRRQDVYHRAVEPRLCARSAHREGDLALSQAVARGAEYVLRRTEPGLRRAG